MVENLMGEVLDDTLHLPRPGAPLRVAPIGLGSWTGRWGLFLLQLPRKPSPPFPIFNSVARSLSPRFPSTLPFRQNPNRGRFFIVFCQRVLELGPI